MANHTWHIAKNLRRARVEAGYTQMQAAQAIGVSYQQIQKYETGANRISAEKLLALRNFYKAQFAELFLGLGNEDETENIEGAYSAFIAKLSDSSDQQLRKVMLGFAASFFEVE